MNQPTTMGSISFVEEPFLGRVERSVNSLRLSFSHSTFRKNLDQLTTDFVSLFLVVAEWQPNSPPSFGSFNSESTRSPRRLPLLLLKALAEQEGWRTTGG